MAEPARKLWTLDEFLAFDDGTDTRYELFTGEIVAMNPPARGHAALVARLARIFGAALRQPCEVFAEVGIILPHRRDTYYQADLAIACTPAPPSDPFVAEPVVIIEVLSPATETVDRGRKVADYCEIGSVRDILLVSSTAQRIDHWRREPDGWKVQVKRGGGHVTLSALEITLDLAEVYHGLLPDDVGAA